MCIGTAKSLCCPPETITILLISYTPIQNKKFNLKKRERALLAINVCLVLSTSLILRMQCPTSGISNT